MTEEHEQRVLCSVSLILANKLSLQQFNGFIET